jgi:small-conductance mechanosensitive channel
MIKRPLVLWLVLAITAAAYVVSPYRPDWEKLVQFYEQARPWNAIRTDLRETRASFQQQVEALRADAEQSRGGVQAQLTALQQEVTRLQALQQQQTQNLSAAQQQNAAEFNDAQQSIVAQLAGLQQQLNDLSVHYVSKAQLDADLRMALAAAARYHPVDLKLGPLPVGKTESLTYAIDGTVPDTAREILVYAYVATHYVKGGGHNFKLFVNVDAQQENAFYLRAVAFAQQAWAYNSENAWLPMPADRTLRVQSDGDPLFGSWNSSIQIIAYR